MKRTILLLTVIATMMLAYAGLALAQTFTAETLDANTLGLGERERVHRCRGSESGANLHGRAQRTTHQCEVEDTLRVRLGSIDGAEVQITTSTPPQASPLPTC